MGNKSKRKSKKPGKISSKREISSLVYYLLAATLIISSLFVFGIRIAQRNIFYKNYLLFIGQTKIVLFPDISQKDTKNYLIQWVKLTSRLNSKYKIDLKLLIPLVDQVQEMAKVGNLEEAKKQVIVSRNIYLSIMKSKRFNTQSIILEDLLSLFLDMEKSVLQNDGPKIMQQYQDFNSKFPFLIPLFIKADVVLIGDLMDRLYKQALFEKVDQIYPIYQQAREAFFRAYKDFKPR